MCGNITMLAGKENIKAYLIGSIATAMLLLLLMIKLRPDKNEAIEISPDYEFTPWIGSKQQWLTQDSNSNRINDISIVEEMKRIKAYRVAEEKQTPDPNVFKREDVKTVRFHIVQESDTLSEISSKYYGTSRRWREIFQANKNVIANPDFLEKGTKLIIPE